MRPSGVSPGGMPPGMYPGMPPGAQQGMMQQGMIQPGMMPGGMQTGMPLGGMQLPPHMHAAMAQIQHLPLQQQQALLAQMMGQHQRAQAQISVAL